MVIPEPIYCRPAAYEQFAASLADLQSDAGLLRGAVAIAAHELVDADAAEADRAIERLAQRVRSRVKSGDQQALLAHLHVVLFDEEGFGGAPNDYYNARNSYLPSVLESRRGIPISLVLVYKCVASRLGLSVLGVNAPAHFLAQVEIEGVPALVDPFYSGRMLTREEALRQIEQTSGSRLPEALPEDGDPMFLPATHREWLARMIRNLRAIFAQTGREEDSRAMQELFALL